MKIEHQRFADEMIKNGGDHIAAYMNVKRCTDRKKAATLGGKLARNVEIAAAVKAGLENIKRLANQQTAQAIADKNTGLFLSLADKRRILAEIALQKHKFKIPYIGKNKKGEPTVKYMSRTANPNEIKQVIELDARLMGEMAVDKREITGKDGAPLVPQTTTPVLTGEAMEILLTKLTQNAQPDARVGK